MKCSYSAFELTTQLGILSQHRSGLFRLALRTLLIGSLMGVGASALADSSSASLPDADAVSDSEPALNPAELVRTMSEAMKSLNYEGTFVHVQGNHITSMDILHSSNSEGELERLRALDGEAREVIRNHSLVTCIWPDSESVIVSKSKPNELLPQIDADLASNGRYELSMGNPDRVAGLATYVVNVMPTDKFRYGYRFWIDQDTHMLLRSMLLDGPQRAVEQVIFTHIEYPVSIEVARFDIDSGREKISWLEPKKLKATSGLPETVAKQVDRVSFGELPEGYKEVSEVYSPMPMSTGPMSHVMLTDGMTSVSVYVEYATVAEQANASAGLSSMGAMNAFGLSTENAFITVVGEVPANTVKAIALAVVIP
ncbi:MucB/RseB C-terminal domain-containing protein [Granulosicoccus antarcticus]|uniref:Sigma factor AlgU regulatory protein MucB n=1 Tax=Granulosicoccus antarcticus IMCC3135 TaxID=1192854 RepID=A0A2Z2NWT3_9GAMM|nr:MucB/RseB C-terminal domain-containing protein [Granulosicoccus antarcticus]ASJ74461.1 Sigma factor AlgU regulatory protein MucB [Granulosicoccus antarcticus IMCC3135]